MNANGKSQEKVGSSQPMAAEWLRLCGLRLCKGGASTDGALAEASDTVGPTSRSYEWDYNPDGAGYRLCADANGDDCVDDADLGIVLEFYGCEDPWTGSCAGGEAADLNEDGIVDDTDLAWVGEDYGAFAWLYEYDVYGNLVYAGSPCVGEYEAAYDAFGRRV